MFVIRRCIQSYESQISADFVNSLWVYLVNVFVITYSADSHPLFGAGHATPRSQKNDASTCGRGAFRLVAGPTEPV